MKKFKLSVFIMALLLSFCFVLAACGSDKGGEHNAVYFTVTFDSRGGSAVESQRVLKGNPIRAPESPTKGDLIFNGWYISPDENAELWNFATDRVNDNITLYAVWKVDLSAPTDTVTYEINADKTGYIVTGAGQDAKIVIPESHENLPVVEICESAFAYSKHTSDILSVTIPDTVTVIGRNAFYSRTTDLASVNIGSGSRLATIGNNAFSGCRALSSIYLPAGVNSIGDSAFNNCGALNSITVAEGNSVYSSEGNNLIEIASHTLIRGSNSSVIPSTVTKIAQAAFRRAQLTSLTIPVSVVTIENYIIQDSAVESITYQGTEEQWESVTKSRYWNMGKTDIIVRCSNVAESSGILVAYFSCTNNTKSIAEYVADITGGTIYQIIPAVPYTSADLNYNSDCRANREQNDATCRPEISGSVASISDYDIIYLGYPIWWGQAPKIIYTFLESYNLSGKTIVPFCTSGSSGIGTSATNMHSSAMGATWLDGRRFSGSASKSDIENWINSLGI